jgi:hypothetical protein
MKWKLVYFLVAFAVVMFFLSAMSPAGLSAQSGLVWSPAQRIRGYAKDSDPPILVADQNRTVHAFNSQWTGGDLAIFYSQWSSSRGWTTPIDVLLSPNQRQAKVLGAYLDPKGIFHVIFFGGTELGAEIYYSRAPAVNASQARAWSSPKRIGPYAGKLASATLSGDDRGDLVVLYSGNRDGNGLYAVQSTDGGDTWSDLDNVFLTDDANQWVYNVDVNLDVRGNLNVVWDVYNKAGISETNYYARLEPGSRKWTLPISLETLRPGDYQVNESTIISYNDELFVFYNYGNPPRHWMRRSKDNGKSWLAPVSVYTSLVGDDGSTVLLIDARNVLHIVLPNRTVDNRLVGLWHGEWTGDGWSDAQPIYVVPYNTPSLLPSIPVGVISQGNVAMLTWRNDPGVAPNGVWFSFANLNASERPVVALPTFIAASPTITPLAKVVSSSTPTPKPFVSSETGTPVMPVADTSPFMGLALGILSVVLLLFVLVVARNIRLS